MPDILFIKTSSLGDVIHHMPAVTEARAHLPAARFVWMAEESFAPLVRLHPAVDEVIAVASRRWRSSLYRPATLGEIAAFVRRLRDRTFDEIIDTQGLLRTGIMARLARGRRHGYDRASIREGAASWLYDVRHRVPRDLHAIARNRTLTGLALGYEPAGDIDYGLNRARLASASAHREAILLHATARPEKEWPEANWSVLGQALAARGLSVLLPWGTAAERARAERIADKVPGSRVPELMAIDEIARRIAGATLVVGVDTGLVHVAAALAVPLVAVFVDTAPGLYGPIGSGPIAVVGGHGTAPSVDETLAAVDRVS